MTDSTIRALVSTKAKREAIASRLESCAAEFGATVTRSEFDEPHELTLTLHAGPYRMRVDLDGRDHCDVFICSWFTYDWPVTYPVGFGADIAGSVNQFHQRKATGMYRTVDEMLGRIGLGLEGLRAEGLI